MAAEAHIENPAGTLERATALINQVRKRAANPDGFVKNADGTNAANYKISEYASGLSREQLRDRVRFERKLELSGEGQRFYDLVRWGIAAPYLNAYIAFESSILPGAPRRSHVRCRTRRVLPHPADADRPLRRCAFAEPRVLTLWDLMSNDYYLEGLITGHRDQPFCFGDFWANTTPRRCSSGEQRNRMRLIEVAEGRMRGFDEVVARDRGRGADSKAGKPTPR